MPTKKKTKRSSPGRTLSEMDPSDIRQRLAAMPGLERASELLTLAGSVTRLKLLYLLEHQEGLLVGDLAHRLEVSVPAVCQHLTKVRIHGLVVPQRKAHRVFVSEVKEVVRIWTGEGGQQVL